MKGLETSVGYQQLIGYMERLRKTGSLETKKEEKNLRILKIQLLHNQKKNHQKYVTEKEVVLSICKQSVLWWLLESNVVLTREEEFPKVAFISST